MCLIGCHFNDVTLHSLGGEAEDVVRCGLKVFDEVSERAGVDIYGISGDRAVVVGNVEAVCSVGKFIAYVHPTSCKRSVADVFCRCCGEPVEGFRGKAYTADYITRGEYEFAFVVGGNVAVEGQLDICVGVSHRRSIDAERSGSAFRCR